ncbi:MAG: hypothetical protein JWQ49_5835 [Edaphobacter sp.]|nr:hypothetical protein [Edaphobacter sp.]
MLVLAGYERIGREELPVLSGSVLQAQGGTGEGVETPEAGYGAGDGGGFGGGDFVWGFFGRGRGRGRGCGFGLVGFGLLFALIGGGGGYGLEGERPAGGRVGEDEPALEGVGGERDFGLFAGVVEVENEIMGETGGEDEWGAFDRQDDGGLEEAGDDLGVGGAQGRRNGGLDGGQADDDDRLGIVERGRGVEAEVEGFAVGEGDGGDVLVFGGVKAAHDADEVDDGADVGRVEARACH